MMKIIIQGPRASGKTTLGNLIQRAVMAEGKSVLRYTEGLRGQPNLGGVDVLIIEEQTA